MIVLIWCTIDNNVILMNWYNCLTDHCLIRICNNDNTVFFDELIWLFWFDNNVILMNRYNCLTDHCLIRNCIDLDTPIPTLWTLRWARSPPPRPPPLLPFQYIWPPTGRGDHSLIWNRGLRVSCLISAPVRTSLCLFAVLSRPGSCSEDELRLQPSPGPLDSSSIGMWKIDNFWTIVHVPPSPSPPLGGPISAPWQTG